jgi:hypothetical protein
MAGGAAGGDGELGRRSGGQGQELREATKTKAWCKRDSMSVGCITREEKREGERGSFTSDELYQRRRKQRRRRWVKLELGRGGNCVRV